MPSLRGAALAGLGSLSLVAASPLPSEPTPCASASTHIAPITSPPAIAVATSPPVIAYPSWSTSVHLKARQADLPGCTPTSILVPVSGTCWGSANTVACSAPTSSLSSTCCINGCTFSPKVAPDVESGGAGTFTTTATFDGEANIPPATSGMRTENWTVTLDQTLEEGIANIVNGYCSNNGLYSPHQRNTSGLTLPGFVGCEVGDLNDQISPMSNDVALFLYNKLEVTTVAFSAFAQYGIGLLDFKRTVASLAAVAIVSGLYHIKTIQETYSTPSPLAEYQIANHITMPSMTGDYATASASATSDPCPLCTGNACPVINPDDDQGQEGPPPTFVNGVQIPFIPVITPFSSKPSSRVCTQYADTATYSCAGCSCSEGPQTGLYTWSEGAYITTATDGSTVTSADICMGHTTFPAASLTKEGVCAAPSPSSTYDWINYCQYIATPKGDHRGDRGYCNCPGDMPYYPSTSTRTTTDKWKSLTLTTTDPCGGYTGLPGYRQYDQLDCHDYRWRIVHGRIISGSSDRQLSILHSYTKSRLGSRRIR